MTPRRPSKCFNYECLEARKMLAGDVSVVENGDLFIRGDELSNQIRIVANEPGEISVIGLRGTTVNGSSDPYIVKGASGLEGGGNRIAQFDGGLKIRLNGGNDRVDIQGIRILEESRIVTGEGNDFVRFIRTAAIDKLTVNTNDGDDTLKFVKSRSNVDLQVSLDAGNDTLQISKSRTLGGSSLRTGSEHDRVRLNRVRFTGVDQVMTQDGNDFVSLRRSNISEHGLDIFAGHGDDEVFVELTEASDVLGEVLVAGQGGTDMLDMVVDDLHRHNAQHSGFERGGTLAFDNGVSLTEDYGLFTSVYYDINYSLLLATPVTVAETTSISEIGWSGIFLENDPPAADNFTIDIYVGDGTGPVGDRVQSFDIGNDLDRIDSGERIDFVFTDTVIYEFRADVDLTLEAGQQYWVSVYSTPIAEGESIQSGFNPTSVFEWGHRIINPADANDAAPTRFIEIYDPATGDIGQGGSGQWRSQLYQDQDLRLYS